MTIIVIFIAKCISFVSQILGLGAGATWPGEIALFLQPHILQKLLTNGPKVVLIAGTNGKTTTSKMITTICETAGVRSFRNESGANLVNGIVSQVLVHASILGHISEKVVVFEIDEASLPLILKEVSPQIVVLLNLFRDQLDRYGEVDVIAEKWHESLSKLPKSVHILINADDPGLAFIGSRLTGAISYFGLEDPHLYRTSMQHATDSIYCPSCGTRLTFGGIYFSHLGKWACGGCKLVHPHTVINAQDFPSPLDGVYNKYNTIAAALVARTLEIPDTAITDGLASFTPAFGRMEEVPYKGVTIKVLLSKNPTGFNESLRSWTQANTKAPLILALNDRIPDGTDVSWIYDVDFELLEKAHESNESARMERIYVTGDRVYDLAVRLKYAGVESERVSVYTSTDEAINQAIQQCPKDKTVWALATYSAMLDIRKSITGKKIL